MDKTGVGVVPRLHPKSTTGYSRCSDDLSRDSITPGLSEDFAAIAQADCFRETIM